MGLEWDNKEETTNEKTIKYKREAIIDLETADASSIIDLKRLKAKKDTVHLTIENYRLYNERYIGELKELKTLDIISKGTEMGKSGLIDLVFLRKLNKLERLTIEGYTLLNFDQIKECKGLKQINLTNCRGVEYTTIIPRLKEMGIEVNIKNLD